jgi:hypothetical protein
MRWLFIRTHESSLSWRRIVWWWESRRIVFNLLILAFIWLLIRVLLQFIKPVGDGSIVQVSGFLLPVLVLINLYYTMVWVFDGMFRKSAHAIIGRVRPLLFLFVLLSTIFAQLLGLFGLALLGGI